jgi:hypothetical protein
MTDLTPTSRFSIPQKSEHYPIARLAVAGHVSLALLAWIGFVPGSFPPLLDGLSRVELVPALLSATISLLVIAILVPVIWRGPAGSRWLAAMLSIFPVMIFAIATLCLIGSQLSMY